MTPSLTIEELIDRVRQEMLEQSNMRPSQARPHLSLDAGALEAVLQEADQRAQPRTKFPNTLNRFPFSASRLAQRAILKLINLLGTDQQIVSGLLIRSIRQVVDLTAQAFAQTRYCLSRLEHTLRKHEHALAWLQDATRSLQARAEALGNLIQEARENTGVLGQEHARLSREMEVVQQTIRELVQQVGEKDRAHEREIASVRLQLAQQMLIAAHSLVGRGARDENGRTAERVRTRLTGELYAAFEERFRGPEALVRERLAPYLEVVRAIGAGTPEAPVLDLGCGRGEWLALLAAEGWVGKGVDTNGHVVAECVRHGLHAVPADALDCLRATPSSTVGAVTSFQLIEHLTFDEILELVDESRRVLRDGGVLILETPNPESVFVLTNTFYVDPTHSRPIPGATMRFFVEARGFRRVEVRYMNPVRTNSMAGADGELSAWFNRAVLGPQDYAVIAYAEATEDAAPRPDGV